MRTGETRHVNEGNHPIIERNQTELHINESSTPYHLCVCCAAKLALWATHDELSFLLMP